MANVVQFRGPNTATTPGADNNSADRAGVVGCVRDWDAAWKGQGKVEDKKNGVLIAQSGEQIRALVREWCAQFPQGATQALDKLLQALVVYK